jgi:hypothetical protein
VTDDGLPNPPGTVSVAWQMMSGPGTVFFANPNAAQTTASFSTAGVYVLRLTADDGAATAYDEVAITVNNGTVAVCLAPIADTYIVQDSPNQNNGTESTLRQKPDAGSQRRILVWFNLDSIPSGSLVLESTIWLYEDSRIADQTIYLHRLTNSWSESQVTWNLSSTGTPWSVAGGDYDTTRLASFSPTVSKQYAIVDVAGVTQAWLTGTPNYGLLLISEGANGEVTFKGKEEKNPNRRPQLCITYQ